MQGGKNSFYLPRICLWGAPCRSKAIWDEVEEKFCRKKYFSNLANILHVFFCNPKKVKLRLEKIQRDFLRGGGTLEKKPHLVSWSIVCTCKRKRGLSIRSLSFLNRALLGKWSCRYVVDGKVCLEANYRRKVWEGRCRLALL